jgi:hypothetical protein
LKQTSVAQSQGFVLADIFITWAKERKSSSCWQLATILTHRGIPCGRVVATIRADFRYIFLLAARVFSSEGLS